MFIVIGTATVDLFVSNLAAMPRSEGDEFTVDSLVFHDEPLRTSLGGNGANSAYALARLGSPVELVGGLGEDHLGDWMAAQLADVGVDMAGVRRYPGMGTATTLILSDMQQNRLAFHHEGANRSVDDSSIKPFYDKSLGHAFVDELLDHAGSASSGRGRAVSEGPAERHSHSC